MVLVFPVMLAASGVKEPPIAGRAAIGVLKQQMVKEPISDAVSSRSEELFAAAIGASSGLSVGSGFVHGEILCWGYPVSALPAQPVDATLSNSLIQQHFPRE